MHSAVTMFAALAACAFAMAAAISRSGASTAEAQDRAGTDVARSVMLALRGDFVPDAVNVASGGVVGEEVRPYLSLTQKLGLVLSAFSVESLLPSLIWVASRGRM